MIAPVQPHQRPDGRADRGARYSLELITALPKDTDHADQGNALDTTAFQNKIGEHRYPQLRRPAGNRGMSRPLAPFLLFNLSLRLPGEHHPHWMNPKGLLNHRRVKIASVTVLICEGAERLRRLAAPRPTRLQSRAQPNRHTTTTPRRVKRCSRAGSGCRRQSPGNPPIGLTRRLPCARRAAFANDPALTVSASVLRRVPGQQFACRQADIARNLPGGTLR